MGYKNSIHPVSSSARPLLYITAIYVNVSIRSNPGAPLDQTVTKQQQKSRGEMTMNKLWSFSINMLCLFGFVFVVFALVFQKPNRVCLGKEKGSKTRQFAISGSLSSLEIFCCIHASINISASIPFLTPIFLLFVPLPDQKFSTCFFV